MNSTQTVIGLLEQYNKNNPYRKIASAAPTSNTNRQKIGTWSYANMYDALYDKYSRYKNFNANMWQEAIKLGEEDQYLAFLDANKDTVLSDQFYDPQYYDYETMMMELFLPFADATKTEMYTQSVYDPVSGEYVDEEIGELTQRQYYEYLLNNVRTLREQEITRDLEQWRKDQLGFWGRLGHDVLATLGEFGEGLLSGLTGVVDFVAAVGTLGLMPYSMNGNEGNYLDAFVDYFGENGLTAYEKRTVRAALDEYERTHTHFRDIDGNITGVGTYVAGIANSLGMMVPAIVTAYFTGGTSLAWMGSATFYASIFSNNMYENATNPALTNSPAYLKITNAAVKTAIEAVIEWGLGKVLGGTISNTLIGLSGGKTVFKGITKTTGAKYFIKSAAQEGLEEFLQDFSTNCIDQFYDLAYEGYGNNGVTIQTLIDSFLIGALSSMFMSGGNVAFSETTSAIRNKKEAGSGDMVIETADGIQKVRGLNRLYYSSILSEFNDKVEKLKRGKINPHKNVKLAQEIYDSLSVISQFYSSLSDERIKNCELLLSRVIEAEKFEQQYGSVATESNEETVVQNAKEAKKATKFAVKQASQDFATYVGNTFQSMVGELSLKHMKKLEKAAKKVEKKLTKDGGVTEVTGAVDTDGIRYEKDADMAELEKKLGKKAVDTLDELRKGYEWVITTDGHIAVESDGYLFVSEAWLKNYKVSDIYKYLEQARILDTLANDKMLAPMVEKLIAFDKEFTGQTDVDAERALMDLLFNKSVYQAFLLSNAGKNMHEFKAFIFQLHEIVKDLGQRSKYHQQLFKGKQAQKRINMLNQIYAQIKETMREPTIKAILNWHIDPQVVGADSVLTERDRQVINQYEQRRRVLSSTGTDRSAYENLAEDIIANADFSDEELALVRKSLNGTATIDEDTEARALLEEADRRMTRYDFEVSPKASLAKSYAQRFTNEYARLLTGGDVDIQLYISLLQNMRDSTSVWYDHRTKYTPGYLQAAQAWENNLDKFADSVIDKLDKLTFEDLRPYLETGVKFYQRAAAELAGKGRSYVQGLGTFTIPHQAAAIAMNDGDIAATQFIADQLDEFKSIYGISARQMITGDLSGMSMAQRNQLTQDMEVLEVESLVTFVIEKLEGMLGGKYIVTPTRTQTKRTTNVYQETQSQVYDFVIAKSIPAEHFISQDILNEDIETRNQIFRKIFTSMDVQNRSMFRANIADALKQDVFKDNREELEYLSQLSDWDVDNWLDTFIEHNNGTVDIINPLTGEILTDTPMGYLFAEIRNKMRTARRMVPLSMFIDVSAFPTIDLEKVNVFFVDAGPEAAGWAAGNRITIDPQKSDDYFGTLVHEINHIMQAKYNMPNGFNVDSARAMPDFLAYVVNHYPNFIKYTLYRAGYDERLEIPNIGTVTEKDIRHMPSYLKDLVAHCGYLLVQGELWARGYDHNGKMVHGFTEIWQGLSQTYLLAPDGKTKFKVKFDRATSTETSYTSDVVAGSALDTAIQKLFLLKGQQERRGYAATSRNTYHSGFTKSSSLAMTQQILSPDVPMMAKYTVKLGDIIRDPQSYLAPEILAMCNGDFSEGNVFYRIKEYVEAKVDGVSIDITDGPNPQYVWVDDNAFDDLLLTSMKSKVESQEHTLATKYKAGEHIPLTEFYSTKELARLGINSSAYIVISPDVATETVFDDEHRTGAIFIKANEKTTNAKIIDSLNHEFRHLLQRYNGFATGFTPNFKVSREMIEDVKKHVPGLFENNTIVRWAKALADTKGDITWEEAIVQRFVYYTTSGELNAYAFNARDLYAKPTLVNKEAGNPVIFMPWYDAKTGEGRYKTEFLAMRADDADTKNNGEKPDNSISIPRVDKPKKYKSATKNDLDDPHEKPVYKYDRRRDFTKKKAEGTNLKFFVKKGQRNQMDPDLQEFVIATTGHEDELPKELWNVIGGKHAGTLTKQALFKWFRTVSSDKINDFTFDLMNRCFFKNDYISSMQELDRIIAADPAFYWAAAVILHSEGISLKSLLVENDIDTFLSFLNTLEGSKWKKKIENLQAKFTDMSVLQADGSYAKYNIAYSEKLEKYMRVLTMQWFDGTLAGAFYVANAFRKSIRLNEQENINATISLDTKRGNAKGDKEVSIADTVSDKNTIKGDYSTSANDIIALYEMEFQNVTYDDMYVYVGMSYYNDLLTEAGLDPRTASPSELRPIQLKAVEYQQVLKNMSYDELFDVYVTRKNSEITGVFDSTVYDKSKDRVNIVSGIKRTSTRILNLVRDGEIRFSELPKAVQDMYQLVDGKTENGKKTRTYELKPEVYSVGRGRAKLPGKTDTGRFEYVGKHNLGDGNQAFRHDTTQILANFELLRETLLAANKVIKDRKNPDNKGSKKNEVGAIVSRGEKASRELINILNKAKATKKSERTRETEFRVAKKKRTSDTPNIFNVVSAIDMPAVLYKILDTSFEDFADTEVQFASRDKNGQLFDKTQFKRGEFDSRVKHEVSNWDAFYEANRDALLSLSRNDILDIIEFYQRGAAILGGPANKFAAFEIFLLGYIVDGARRNFSNWNFSDAEIEMIEKLYEQKASEHGSGLQAVQQMLKVVDPMKKVRQRMFDDWDAISDGDKDDLIAKVDEMQTEKDDKRRKQLAQEILQMLDQFGERQIAADKSKFPRWSKEWWRRLGAKTKSFRYLSMLSGPATWVRNSVTNVVLTGFNKSSDIIGNVIFTKKGYRDTQWDLANTKISSDAKSFIDTYILSNPIFNPTREDIKNGAPNLYNLSSKYDERQTKKIKNERQLLVTLIAKAYQRQYTQEHRFDSKAMVNIGKFIDQMISDEKFVKFVAGRYFGKILTIEAQRGNIDLSQGLSAEVLDLFAESVVLANQEYMHKRSFLADFLDGIRDKHPVAYDVLNFWQPFLNSSFNWFVESLKYTPLGLAGAIVRANRLEAQITKLDAKRAKGEMVADSRTAEFFIRRDIGKGTIGLFLSVLGMLLAASGRLRIDEDDDKFYLFIDEELKIDISDVFASSSILVGASIAQKFITQANGETASIEDVLSMATNVMLDGFFAADILDRHKWGGTWEDLLTETESIFRSFVPQFFQTLVACTNNDKIRYSPGLKGVWERWVNSWLPGQPLGNRKINPYTGEIEDKYSLPIIGGILQKGILGAKIYWVDVTEEERMCRELNVNKNELTGELTVNNKKYELDRLALNKKYGELNKNSLAKIKSQKHKVEMPDGTFKTLSWDKMSDKQRANVLSRTFTQNADIAKIYMWTQVMGKKFYASASLLQTLRSLGITQNVYRGDKGFVE